MLPVTTTPSSLVKRSGLLPASTSLRLSTTQKLERRSLSGGSMSMARSRPRSSLRATTTLLTGPPPCAAMKRSFPGPIMLSMMWMLTAPSAGVSGSRSMVARRVSVMMFRSITTLRPAVTAMPCRPFLASNESWIQTSSDHVLSWLQPTYTRSPKTSVTVTRSSSTPLAPRIRMPCWNALSVRQARSSVPPCGWAPSMTRSRTTMPEPLSMERWLRSRAPAVVAKILAPLPSRTRSRRSVSSRVPSTR